MAAVDLVPRGAETSVGDLEVGMRQMGMRKEGLELWLPTFGTLSGPSVANP
jgi:hypothetical protein